MNVFETNHYSDILRDVLSSRCARNPLYSQRSFARDLGLSSGTLSLIMRKKLGLSQQTALTIAKKLSMNPEEQDYFCTLVDSLDARSSAMREAAQIKLQILSEKHTSQKSLALDAFQVISDWYHFAIRQLMKLPHYQDDPTWIAKALGIHVSQVESAIDKLSRLELIEKVNGKWAPTADSLVTPSGVPSEALRKFHMQVLEKAMDALKLQNVSQRHSFTTVMPIDTADLTEIGEKVQKFQRKLVKDYSKKPSVNHVYAMTSQFFNLTTQLEDKKNET